MNRKESYRIVRRRIESLLDQRTDWIAAMATVACELYGAFDHFHWTGFYRTVSPDYLRIGPYQGGHGCIDIPFGKGVCGTCADLGETQLVDDVETFPGHIACSSTTRSEIVVPVKNSSGDVVAVLDVDSDNPAAFDGTDRTELESLCSWLGERYGAEATHQIESVRTVTAGNVEN